MAQAQVTITAVDKTQAAINSAVKGMKSLERTAKVTAKAVNLAFGLLSGTILVSAFGKITEAAKKTEEGRRSLDRFNQALKDPALVSAANAFTTTLINGFTRVVEFAADATRAVTQVGRDLGLFAQPVDRSQLGKGEGGRRGRRMQVDPINQMENDWKFRQKMMEIEKQRAKEAAAAAEKFASEIKRANEATRTEMEKTVASFDSFKKDIDFLLRNGVISPEVASERIRSELDQILPEIEVTGKREIIPGFKKATDQMQEFAKQAAANIQSAFADFLFDPFENGLRGMLSGFLNVIRRMVAEIAAQEILKAIFLPFASGSGFFSNFAKSLTGKAMGGPVSANTPYIVGERGPELFVPGTSGGIVPNNKLGMGGGVTVAPVYNIDARGATADLQRSLPGILQENNRRIFDELDRRYGIGR
jgi:hypothetical protein